jgi:hypothetical protein
MGNTGQGDGKKGVGGAEVGVENVGGAGVEVTEMVVVSGVEVDPDRAMRS